MAWAVAFSSDKSVYPLPRALFSCVVYVLESASRLCTSYKNKMAQKTITSDDFDFDYEVVKTKYTGKVNRFLQMQYDNAPYTREWINKTMLKVKFWRNTESSNPTKSCHPVQINDDVYDVVTINGVEKLVCLKNNKVLEVLDSEESFNVFVDFHLRDKHCRGKGFCRMYNVLNNFFDFSNVFLESFLTSCNVCFKVSNINKENKTTDEHVKGDTFNGLVHIIVLDISSCIATIHEYKYLLVYRETVSGYVLLRPLTELDEGEVASELYKIFVDFGPPETIQTTHIDFLKEVLILLKRSPIKYKTIVSDEILDGGDLKCKIVDYINKWTECSSCSDWPLTCYAIQFSMNTEGDKAMEKVFGRRVGQTAKRILFPNKENKSEVVPTSTKDSRDSASSVSFDEDNMSDTENMSSVDGESTSMDTESILNFADCGSATDQSTDKPEKLKCIVCDHVFLFTSNINTCTRCKKFVHIYCGLRITADSENFEEIEFICNNCLDLDSKVKISKSSI